MDKYITRHDEHGILATAVPVNRISETWRQRLFPLNGDCGFGPPHCRKRFGRPRAQLRACPLRPSRFDGLSSSETGVANKWPFACPHLTWRQAVAQRIESLLLARLRAFCVRSAPVHTAKLRPRGNRESSSKRWRVVRACDADQHIGKHRVEMEMRHRDGAGRGRSKLPGFLRLSPF